MDVCKAFLVVFIGLVMLGCDTTAAKTRPGNRHGCSMWKPGEEQEDCLKCNVSRPKEVTLVVRNVLRVPNFEESVTLNCTRYKFLWDMLIKAADINSAFKFSASYFPTWHGFFIDSINGLAGNWTLDQTFWEILDGNDTQTQVGVSKYVPKNGETVTFNFTAGGHTS